MLLGVLLPELNQRRESDATARSGCGHNPPLTWRLPNTVPRPSAEHWVWKNSEISRELGEFTDNRLCGLLLKAFVPHPTERTVN
jgi:hypothetical protein